MKDFPEVSIIIPYYNQSILLLRALRSIFFQTFENYEIIIVDDGSDEDCYPILEALKINKLSYYKLPRKNANVARNFGIRKASGKYIAMLDSDDEWMKFHLEKNIGLMKKHDCDGIFSSILCVDNNGKRIYHVRPLYENEKMINYLLDTIIGAQTSTLFMRSDAAKEILWDETLYRHQDYDFVLRFSKQFKWFANHEVTSIYHAEPNAVRSVDFNSCKKFIERNKDDILLEVYFKYHKRMLNYAIALKSEKEIIDHYLKSSMEY
jgi:glycosyltransferase involved in cell wall biosynthesis